MSAEIPAAILLIAVPIAFNLAFFELGRSCDDRYRALCVDQACDESNACFHFTLLRIGADALCWRLVK